jgi:hypothetical protein
LSEEAGSEEPRIQDITSLDIYSLIGLFIGLLSAKAWETMGLRVKPGTDKIERDFDQARTAIDTIDFLVQKLKSRVPEPDRSRLESLVGDLKLNFVRVSEPTS